MKTLLAAAAVLLFASTAEAQIGYGGTSTRIGNQSYYSFDNGITGSSTHIGDFSYHSYSDGSFGSSQRIGSQTYHSFTPAPSYQPTYRRSYTPRFRSLYTPSVTPSYRYRYGYGR